MESESGRLNWLLKPLFSIYLMVCLFFLFKNNPYLYSTETLKSIFQKEQESLVHTVPAIEDIQGNPSDLSLTFNWRQNNGRTGTYNDQLTFGRKYGKLWIRDLWVNGDETFNKASFVWDDSGYYLTAGVPQLVKTDDKGQLVWKLSLENPESKFKALPILTKTRLYATTTNGRIFCLDKEKGRIIWTSKPVDEIRGAPVLVDSQIYFFGVHEENLKNKTHLFQANPWTGVVRQTSAEDVGSINPYPPTINEELNALYVGSEEGNLYAINYQSGKLLFKTSTSDKILSAILLAQKRLAFTTMDGKLVSVDARTGALVWETDLESASETTPSFVPTFDYLVAMTNNGYLQTIDFKTGEKQWKFLANSEGSTKHHTFSLRLNGPAMESYDLKWKNKGYVIFAPCASKKICVYSPDHGKVLARILLEGEMASEPIFDGKDFIVTVKTERNGALKLMRMGESSGHLSNPPSRASEAKISSEDHKGG
jgi:outer membrane protein assembly factor BamB